MRTVLLFASLVASLTLALAACSGTDDPPCTGDACATPTEDSPRILTISSNVSKLDELGTLIITAVVTDPNGVDDLIGGALVDVEANATYGAFATSAAEGAYEIRLRWGDLDLVRGIDAPVAGAPRMLRARFYDVAGHVAEQDLTITLHCSRGGLGVCDGDCVDLQHDPDHCGACRKPVPEGATCNAGNPGCVMGPENTAAACSDGCSNDGDPYVDCNDFNCCSALACPTGTTCNP